jgi:hypothetical protein
MKRTILGFCGVAPIQLKEIGPVRGSSQAQRDKWLAQVAHLAEKLR